MRPMSRAVDRLLRGLGIARDVARVEAIDVWGTAASKVLGPDAVTTRAVRIDGATLVVAVPDPGWASEIRLKAPELIAALRAAAPRSGIAAIRAVPAHARYPRRPRP